MIKNHFTATGIVFNSNNEILMIHHNKLQVWLPPGGHVDENELPDNAVLREIFEETGIKAKIILTQKRLSLTNDECKELEQPFVILLENIEGDGTHNHIDMVYLCSAENEELIPIPQKSEVNGIGWFSLEKIKELNTFDNVVQTVSQALIYLSSTKA